MFINAVMLAGIGGAVVPLVLHLLNRYRFRTVQWGAMMFLSGNDPRQTQRNRLKQILLLLIRMGLVAALAVCLARPVVYSHWVTARGTPASVVILLDRSPAMGLVENRRSRLAMAEGAVNSILSTLQSGDEVTLVTLGDAPGEEAGLSSTTDLAGLADRVQAISVGPELANFADGLNRAAEILAGSERLNREVFVVCGKEASGWKDVNTAFGQAWNERWGATSAPKMVVVTVGSEAAENVAVTQLRLVHPPALRGQTEEVEATIHNYGQVTRGHVPVNFRVGGKMVAGTAVSVGPGGEAVARQAVVFPDAGSHVVTAQIPTSGLSSDNANQLSVDVMDALPVLIVGSADSPFIPLALAPFHAAGWNGPDLAQPTVVDPAQRNWADSLSNYKVMVLADVPWLSAQQIQAVEMFVYGGGGLLIAPGEGVRPGDYNDAFYKDGAGLMPAMLGTPTPADGAGATSIGKIDRTHPAFDFLRDRPNETPSPVIRRYFPATVAPGGEEVATLSGGEPFLVAGSFGKGRVLLVTTALDEKWGMLPLDNFFLPFVQSMVSYLAAQPSARNMDLGQPLVATFDGMQGKARLIQPGGLPAVELTPMRQGDQAVIRYMPMMPGEYDLSAKVSRGDGQFHFTVRRPPGVSDLTPVTEEQWKEMSGELGFEHIDASTGNVEAALGMGPRERELWPWLLGLVIGLAVAEVGLERLWTMERA